MLIDFTHHPFIESFCAFDVGGYHIDLHNNFKCTSVKFSKQSNIFTIGFNIIDAVSSSIKEVTVIFDDVVISVFSFQPSHEERGLWTIDLMYRGRFEDAEGILLDGLDGRNYYYVNFFEDYTIELFAKTVTAHIEAA